MSENHQRGEKTSLRKVLEGVGVATVSGVLTFMPVKANYNPKGVEIAESSAQAETPYDMRRFGATHQENIRVHNTGGSFLKNEPILVETAQSGNSVRWTVATGGLPKVEGSERIKHAPDFFSKNIPLSESSKALLIYPSGVKVRAMGQRAFNVRNGSQKWSDWLRPYDKNLKAQIIVEGGKKIINYCVETFGGSIGSLAVQGGKLFVNWSDRKQRRGFDRMARMISRTVRGMGDNYNWTLLERYPGQRFIETAREYVLDLEGKGKSFLALNPSIGSERIEPQSLENFLLFSFDLSGGGLSVEEKRRIIDNFFRVELKERYGHGIKLEPYEIRKMVRGDGRIDKEYIAGRMGEDSFVGYHTVEEFPKLLKKLK